jgi:hypothetical protein
MDKLLIILGALVLVIVGPILTIWALDTIFPALNIPYTFETWFATAILTAGVAVRK